MCDGCRSEWKEKTSDAAGACTCCKAVVRTSLRELEDTITRDGHVLEKITEEVEDGDQGYVLLAQDDHDHEEDEEEPDEVENQEQEQQSEVEGQQQEDEVMAAVQDESLEYMDQVEDITAIEDDRLVSVVALDEMTIADDSGLDRDVEEEDGMNHVVEDEQDSRDVDIGVVLEEKRMLDSSVATPADVIEDSVMPIIPAVPCPVTLTNPSHPDHNSISQDNGDVPEDTAEVGDSTVDEQHIFVPQVSEAISEDDNRTTEVDTNCEVSIGSDICEREQDDHAVPFQDLAAFEEPVAPLSAADDLPLPLEILDPTAQEAGEVEQEEVTTSTGLDLQPNEQNEIEEDKAPETPTNSAATQRSDRMFLLERKRSLSLSLDGSVASEMEGGEPSTVDQLKSALQAERKALGALYAELEEERNAAAIATNQTMAMINRLQEEKAAMQMEALQYQRMMEEQSEYDQEALQLLNELVTKREREKQELERELELYRQKVQHYEDRERRRTASFKANGVVSPSGSGTSVSSSGEDSDGHSDDYCELGESPDGGNVQSSSDAALGSMRDQDSTKHLAALDDSLTYFEMERLSILEELKTLEERLFTLEDDDINTSKQVTGHSSSDFDLSADGLQLPEHVVTGDKARFGGRASISRGKSLLPLFDAVGDETCDQMPSSGVGEADQADDSATKPVSVLVKEQERLAIIEEVDHVYERLQALEADKEFLRHCIKSLKKGDKGMDLLQEILQHLRDLRNVELHVKNAGDAIAANSA